MDRRIRKSQEAILAAFVGLLAEKEFEQITINDIADRADVNRGTVYLHYGDKFALLDQCIEAQLSQLLASTVDGTQLEFPTKTVLRRALEYLDQNRFFYTALQANKAVPAFRNRLMAVVTRRISEQLASCSGPDGVNQELLMPFLASAITGALEWWMMRSMPYSPAEMADQLWLLVERFQVMPQAAD